MKIELIQFFAAILLMLVTGVFWGPWFALHRSMKELEKGEFIHIVKILSSNLAGPMRILMPSCIVLMALSVYSYPQKESIGFYFSIVALLLIILSLIVTVAVEVPIVKQIEQWTIETIPHNVEAIQNKWLKFHVIRTFAAIFSFASFIVAILFF